MATKTGAFTISSTGNVQVVGLTFLPTRVRFFLAGSGTSTADATCRFSAGSMTATQQWARSSFSDGAGHNRSTYNNDRCIKHWKYSSGFLAAVEATFVSFDTNGGGDFGFTVNATAADANISIGFEADS